MIITALILLAARLGLPLSRIALAGVLVAVGASSPAMAQDVVGLWRTPVDGGGTVRISRCGADICGTIVDSPRLRANPDQRDVRNRDAAKRDRRLQGLTMLRASPTGSRRWGDGWVYNPEDGRTYNGSIELAADGTLRLRGCVVAPLCRTQTWSRVQ